MNAKRMSTMRANRDLFLPRDIRRGIHEAYCQHVRRVSNLLGRDVLLSSKPAFDRMEVSTITALGLPIICSVASHCVAYIG